MFMYQYRQEIERIIENINGDKARQHTTSLYDSGLINLVEWNSLDEYIKIIERI